MACGCLLLSLIWCIGLIPSTISHTMLDVMAHGAVQSIQSNAGEGASMLKDLFEINDNQLLIPKSRQKRIIELPKGMVFELKWNIDVPVQTYTRFTTFWQFALLIDALYPAEFLHDTDTNPYREIVPPPIAEILQDTFTNGRVEGEEEDVILSRNNREAEGRSREVGLPQQKKTASRIEREAVYTFVENLLEWSGLPSRPCLLRTICEVAEAPFKQELLGDLINTIFRPSIGATTSSGDDYEEFLEAEKHGRRQGLCHMQYDECPETVFDRMPFFKTNLF